MPKIMLVEDDNNLREIYEARLQAEGYEIASAGDGEEALVVAKKEKPDLVISDVMMPKISGFEMLDILRNTDGLKDVKVIMLTALGQVDDKSRADKLGADRYLVKSQVTLEDIVKAAHDLLSGEAPATAAQTEANPTPPAAPVADDSSAFSQPQDQTSHQSEPTAVAPAPIPQPAVNPQQVTGLPTNDDLGPGPAPVAPAPGPSPSAAPLSPPVDTPTDQVAASAPGGTTSPAPTAPLESQTAADEQKEVQNQIENFINHQTVVSPAPTQPAEPSSAPALSEPPVAPDAPVAPAQTPPLAPAPEPGPQPAPASQPAAPVPAPATPSPQPVSPPAPTPGLSAPRPTEAVNDNTINEAVNNLIANTPHQSAHEAPPPSQKVAAAPPVVPPTPANKLLTKEPTETSTSESDTPSLPSTPAAAPSFTLGDSARVSKKKVIQPLGDITHKPDINQLIAQEKAKEQAMQSVENPGPNAQIQPTGPPPSETPAANEEAVVDDSGNLKPAVPPKPGDNPSDIAI